MLNAFITVTAESALDAARSAEAQIARGGWKGPLHGIPIAVKDLLDTAGVRTTAASALFKDRVPVQDAEVVRRLRAAGAVLLGKLNMHELAFGGSSAISYFGAVHNPWDVAYSPGGSSGGSAAAVAGGLCYAALGSDTGGSIREPAAYCGIVGLKPTYGRVSTCGAIPLSWSLDHIGPMTRTVADAALVLEVIAGYDSQDPGSVDLPVPEYATDIAASTSALRLGILKDYFYENLHPEIEAATQSALSVLKGLTRSLHEVAPLATDGTYASVMKAYVAILTAEAYEFHKDYIAKSPERSEEHTSELQSLRHLVCRLLLDTSSTELYTLSLHDALPISSRDRGGHAERSVGSQGPDAQPARGCAARNRWDLCIGDESLRSDPHRRGVRISQGLHRKEPGALPGADSQATARRGGRDDVRVHSEPASAGADPPRCGAAVR